MLRSRLCLAICGALLLALSAAPAAASFHQWRMSELFSNADGSLQFIELFTTSGGQQFTNNRTIRSTQGPEENLFDFPSNTPTPTNNHRLLLATQGVEEHFGGVDPDFIIPDGFLFLPNGTVDFLNAQANATYENLPTDGVMSLHYPGGTAGLNTPTNHAGNVGFLPEPTTAAIVACTCSLILLRGHPRRV